MSARSLLIAIHDVAPATLDECKELLRWTRATDARAPVSLLAVPSFHHGEPLVDSAVCRRWIDDEIARGSEVVLHGYTHRDEAAGPRTPQDWWRRRVLTAREGEFARCDMEETHSRVERGLCMFERCGWRTTGFVPPAWALNDAVLTTLRELPFDYCTVTSGFHDLNEGRHLRVPVISTSARNRWRRIASQAWLASAVSVLDTASCVRVALHPEDARHDDMRLAWQTALRHLLSDREPLTKHAWLLHQSKSVGRLLCR